MVGWMGVGEYTYVDNCKNSYVFYCQQEDFSIICEINGAVPRDTGVIGFLNESNHIFVT